MTNNATLNRIGKPKITGSARWNSCPAMPPKTELLPPIVGFLFGYAQLTNARALALVGDREASAYELPFFLLDAAGQRPFFGFGSIE